MGGISKFLTSDKHTIFQFVSSVFVAGFVGLLVGGLCIHYHVEEAWAFFFCGSSGYAAENMLALFQKHILTKAKLIAGSN